MIDYLHRLSASTAAAGLTSPAAPASGRRGRRAASDMEAARA
ncbi:hypothetical protein [Streptacidiphilus jiangxiensis]|nr:hypothetical protein [Streptacidiphilus jiangxiensis]